MRDFLGNEYGPGDLVIYAASSGRSITMVIGRVVKITERQTRDYCEREDGTWGYTGKPALDRDGSPLYSVRIQPLDSSRWKQHDQRPYYTDSRTGERIDRCKHVKKHGYYTLDSTGEVLPPEAGEYYRYVKTRRTGWGDGEYALVPEKNKGYVPSQLRTYHGTVFEDYVEEHLEGPKPVTITVTENIVKWGGELPDA